MALFSVGTFAIGVGQRMASSALVSAIKSVRPIRLAESYRYRERLREKLAEMPFLFRDMKLSARDDYVALDVLTVTNGQLKPSNKVLADFSGPLPKFRENRRAIIFGDGGYGKTTLFRNIALQCLEKKSWQKMFGRRGLVPVYVPLKIVKTSSEFPIIEGIQAADPYFSGKKGLKRLTRFGNAGKLILFLDGYDEMPYTGGFDHARRELELLFEPNRAAKEDQLREKNCFEASVFWPAYQAIRNSRLYLASRREFFEYNSFYADKSVQRWMVRGLDDKRIELVERIFGKYREQTRASSGCDLNAELFLQELIRRGDTDLVELSKSPLFLTVMCYVYVRQLNLNESSTLFSLGASRLSKTCIRLLLEDLDKYKSRGASPAERQAIQNRRSAYPEEKYKFLAYFAVGLYERAKGFFDEAYVTSAAASYFSGISDSEFDEEISRGLRSSDPTSNIVKQIILSGLFVLVDKQQDTRFFDFPHRKFREALAVEYFDNDRKICELLSLISNRSYSELLLVFLEQSERRGVVLDAIVKQALNPVAPQHAGELLVDAIGRLPVREAEVAAMKVLEQLEAQDHADLPIKILDYLPSDNGNRRYILDRFSRALSSDLPRSISRWAAVAAKVDVASAITKVESAISSLNSFKSLRSLVYSTLLNDRIDSPVIDRYLAVADSVGNSEVAVTDIFRNFYLGKSTGEKSDFLLRLNRIADRDPGSNISRNIHRLLAAFNSAEEDNPQDVLSLEAMPVSGWH